VRPAPTHRRVQSDDNRNRTHPPRDEELEGRLAESRRELFNLRFQLATGSWTTRAHRPRPPRGGRILTVLRDREIAKPGTYFPHRSRLAGWADHQTES